MKNYGLNASIVSAQSADRAQTSIRLEREANTGTKKKTRKIPKDKGLDKFFRHGK